MMMKLKMLLSFQEDFHLRRMVYESLRFAICDYRATHIVAPDRQCHERMRYANIGITTFHVNNAICDVLNCQLSVLCCSDEMLRLELITRDDTFTRYAAIERTRIYVS